MGAREGVIIGTLVSNGTSDGYVYDQTSGIQMRIDLIPADSGWERIFIANAINNKGQIIGEGRFESEWRSFLLTPIPEPSTSTFLVACLLISQSRCLIPGAGLKSTDFLGNSRTATLCGTNLCDQ